MSPTSHASISPLPKGATLLVWGLCLLMVSGVMVDKPDDQVPESIADLIAKNLTFKGVMPNDPSPLTGPYEVRSETFHSDLFDSTDQNVEVWYPMTEGKHPLIAYAHGFAGGGVQLRAAYFQLLSGLASWGYVVVAPRACDFGCRDDPTSLPRDPTGFAHYYKQQLLAIAWAKQILSPVHNLINFNVGVGIAGHSMGGQATLFSSAYQTKADRELMDAYDLKAAVLHHPFTHNFPGPGVPAIIFTGTADYTATPAMSESIFNNGNNSVKALVNKIGSGHHAPDVLGFDPLLPQWTVAWFKVFLDETPIWGGYDWQELLSGNSKESLCNGGFGDVAACEVVGLKPL